jgi:hypothetical protein
MSKIAEKIFSFLPKTRGGCKITKKAPWFLGQHIFLFVLLLILIDLIVGGIIFYRYAVIQAESMSEVNTNVKFDSQSYSEVLNKIKARQELFEAPLQDDYKDPFKTK